MDILGSKISEFQRLLLEIFSLDPCLIFLKSIFKLVVQRSRSMLVQVSILRRVLRESCVQKRKDRPE